MGTGASELKQGFQESQPVSDNTKKSYPPKSDAAVSQRRDEIRRRTRPQENTKDIANIFSLPPLPDEEPVSQNKFDPTQIVSSDSGDSLLVRVSISPDEKRKNDVSRSNLSLDNEPSSKELDSLTSEIDVALEGHNDVMKNIRGVYFIHSVTSRSSSNMLSNSDISTTLRPKGSTIEPLPGMIPVRVNWSDSEKLTEQEKILYEKFKSMKASEESEKQAQDEMLSRETDGERKGTSGKGEAPLNEEEISKPEPKPIIIRFDYTEEELDLMRNIEREFGVSRCQKLS